jgi:hypothetical protein
LSASESRELNKILQVLFLGQLVGLPTLHSIMEKYGIKSNNRQKQYTFICKKLTINELKNIFSAYFEREVSKKLIEMSKKDSSIWSRELATVIIDDSVFKHWIANEQILKDFEAIYGAFFSGQFGRSVYGIKVLTLGISIGTIFYPLYFDFVKKTDKSDQNREKATDVAIRLVKKWHSLVEKLQKNDIVIPKIHFSCDNGYSDHKLAQTCTSCGLIYISVPKKTQQIKFCTTTEQTTKTKIDEFIQLYYLAAEKHHKTQSDEPFLMRIKATLCAHNQEVTILFFRLNGSKKVSVIYSTDTNIFAKTLRRHWFNRTQIEQFFKLLKHTLKIQESRAHHANGFASKIGVFFIIALHCQLIVKELRAKNIFSKKQAMITLQRTLANDVQIEHLLQNILFTKDS